MGILDHARSCLAERCARHQVDLEQPVSVAPLTSEETIGAPAGCDFALQAGRERVVEAQFLGARGQAFTDTPSVFYGTLSEVLELPLFAARERAVCVATMNAVLRHLGLAAGTVHCRDGDPAACGPELARTLEARHGRVRVGLVGFQPAILASLVEHLGAQAVCVVDRSEDNIGQVKCGVEVWDGETAMPRLIGACDLALVTGSTVVNGSIDSIVSMLRYARKPYVFFGSSIAGAAALLNLDRLCPFSR